MTTPGHEVFVLVLTSGIFSDDYQISLVSCISGFTGDPRYNRNNYWRFRSRGSNGGKSLRMSGLPFLPFNDKIVRLSREHNDANVISLGARFLSDEEMEAIIRIFLETPFSNDGKHIRRLKKF